MTNPNTIDGVGAWLNLFIRRGYVQLTECSVYIWTPDGADYMKSARFNADPNRITPVVHCENMAKQLNADDVIALAGGIR
jgi:hypothetical protein